MSAAEVPADPYSYRPPGPGRRPSLTLEVRDRIEELLRSGCFVDEAAEAVGVGRSSIFEWLARGERAHEAMASGAEVDPVELRYLDFFEVVTRARGEAKVAAHSVIRRAMLGDKVPWKERIAAATWYLERVGGAARYGRRQINIAVEQTELDEAGAPVIVTDERRKEVSDRLAKAIEARSVQVSDEGS